MKTYKSHKEVKATPMSIDEAYGRKLINTDNETPTEAEGYLVEYETGYQSWSPKTVFDKGYTQIITSNLSFGQAIEALKEGKKVAREGWNGKGMFLFLVQGSTFKVNRPPLLGIYEEGTEVNYHAHIDMKTVDDTIVPWLASQTDMLAEDWAILD